MTADNRIENNQVTIFGEVVSILRFSHEVFGDSFYTFDLSVKRCSGIADIIPVLVSSQLLDASTDYTGSFFQVNGQFRSYNQYHGPKLQVVLSVFAREIYPVCATDCNHGQMNIKLNGYVCKPPVYRETPLGRKITELLLAVNRPYGKSDYIPCICWGENATFAAIYEVGHQIQITGRIQSREYVKKISDTETVTRTTYEVSASKIS